MTSPLTPAYPGGPGAAGGVTTEGLSPQVRDAILFLTGKKALAAADVVKLEKEIARQGERDRARELHKRRIEIDEETAYSILSGGTAPRPEMLKLAKRLAGDQRFGLARRVLKIARSDLKKDEFPKIFVEIFQKSALYTYKDPDLPVAWRLDRALEILQEVEVLATTENSESLGLAGAIHKRKWEVDQGRQHLERALFYYLRGYAQGAPETARANVLQYLRETPDVRLRAEHDQGYNGINAAFVLDLLARQEEEEAVRAGLASETAAQRRRGARLIREEIIRSVPALLDKPGNEWLAEEWWFYATIGEAYFGLGEYAAVNYDNAIDWLVTRPEAAGLARPSGAVTAGALEIPGWEYESTARQLARLALLQRGPDMPLEAFEASNAWVALKVFLGGDEEAVRSAFRGKFGLALSGGGFRASLFHIGVLARLAELGVLPHIEVLSCVSGGSIIGAQYYLEVKRLLETKSDDEIRPRDYVEIVERLEREFLAGVKRNIRMRVLAEWTTNLKMIFKAGYSRTLRVGELYERELFSRVPDGAWAGPRFLPDWLARLFGYTREKRWLNTLYILPLKADGTRQDDFKPRTHNWRRKNKAPVLILNATALNTGHNWQFTGSFMGEPPTPINAEIDANERLRRMYYKDAPKQYRQIRLGHAVAASSCVPGLFEPLTLDALYPSRSLRLVDGGVCDNQGTASLLEQDCTVTLVSDASGQMESLTVPSSGVIGVPLRANSILQARVREAEYTDVASRKRSSLLRGLMFIHLKQDLVGEQVAWKDCPSHLKESDFVPKRAVGHDGTTYNVAASVERRLAAIRTDLDSFNDLEACALMTSAYWMTGRQFSQEHPCVEGFESDQATGNWRFLAVKDVMRPASVAPGNDGLRQRLDKVLQAGASTAFKVWKLSPALVALKWALAVLLIAGVSWLFYDRREAALLPAAITGLTFGFVGKTILTMIVVALVTAVLNAVVGRRLGGDIKRVIRWRDTIRYVVAGIAMATVGFVIARLHLHVFDKLYLRCGRLDGQRSD